MTPTSRQLVAGPGTAKNVYNRNMTESGPNERLRSEELAALMVDALLQAKLLQKEQLELARALVTEEIDARKAMDDY